MASQSIERLHTRVRAMLAPYPDFAKTFTDESADGLLDIAELMAPYPKYSGLVADILNVLIIEGFNHRQIRLADTWWFKASLIKSPSMEVEHSARNGTRGNTRTTRVPYGLVMTTRK